MALKLGSNDTAILAGSSVVKQILLGSSPKFAAPVLDHVPNAAAAYSLRRLSNAYTGPVVKVRRSSDSTTADFTAADVVDGTLTAWVGAGDGFVHTWYDQSGNERNATQATAAAQPKVVSSGTLVTEGGRPTLQFDGVDDRLAADSISEITSGSDKQDSRFVVYKTSGSSPSEFFCFANTGSDIPLRGLAHGGTASRVLLFFRDNASVTKSHTVGVQTANQRVTSLCCNGTSASVSLDGASYGPFDIDVGATTLNTATIGAVRRLSTGSFFTGTISELIVYPSDVSASRELAEGEIAWHYGLQAKLPYDHAYAPQALGGSSQTVPTDSDAIAYLEAVSAADGAAVERSVAIAIDDFVKGLKADGLWSAIGSACILAGARTVSGALVPLKGAAPTGYNWVASDYSRSLGLQGDGSTKYIDSNRANNADGQDDRHIAAYRSVVVGTAARSCWGAGITSSGDSAHFTGVGGTEYASLCWNGSYTVLPGASYESGIIAAARSQPGYMDLRFGTKELHASSASAVPSSGSLLIFGRGTPASPDSLSPDRLSFYSIGASVDLALLDARVSALMTAIGAAL